MSEADPYPLIVSVDIETTGGTPYNGEMISIGAVVLDGEPGSLIVPDIDSSWCFQANLQRVNGRSEAGTMKWWEQYPYQLSLALDDAMHPKQAMTEFVDFLESFRRKVIFAAWPAAFDWAFVNCYMWHYVGRNPFGYSPFCIKNFALGKYNNVEAILGSRKDAELPDGLIVTPEELSLNEHIALNDAYAQAHIITRLLNEGSNSSSGTDPVWISSVGGSDS